MPFTKFEIWLELQSLQLVSTAQICCFSSSVTGGLAGVPHTLLTMEDACNALQQLVPALAGQLWDPPVLQLYGQVAWPGVHDGVGAAVVVVVAPPQPLMASPTITRTAPTINCDALTAMLSELRYTRWCELKIFII